MKKKLPEYHMSKWGKLYPGADPKCEGCCGRGYAVYQRCGHGNVEYAKYDNYLAVQRCDECGVIKQDEVAAVLANVAGIKCRLKYPCILKDQSHLFPAPRFFKTPTEQERQAEDFSSSRFNLEHAMSRALKKLPPKIREQFRTYRADHDSRLAFSNDGKWVLAWQLRPHPELPIGPKIKQPPFGCVRLFKVQDLVIDAWTGKRL